MNVRVRFVGFHTIYEQFKEPLAVSFPGERIDELVGEMIGRYGKALQDELRDERSGAFDPVIQVRVNERILDRSEHESYILEEGDKITFMKLISGG